MTAGVRSGGGFVGESAKESVRARAVGLGFAACGFTSAEPLDIAPLLAAWIDRGRHGDMQYLARGLERRVDPRRALASACSVIVAAWPYSPAPPPRSDWRRRLTGRIAAYAFGDDYHDVLGARLVSLAAFVETECGGAAARAQVDAGPLVEKDLARRAGLGWFGRNTNLLTRDRGSYVLFGCLVTEARFEPDPPFAADHCGTCRACIPACPTGALDDGPTIDATRCISYLTIELRGPVPFELRPHLGNWVFGCDVCQDVCPWTPAAPAHPWLEPSLPELLALDEERFRARYAATAVARAKRRGLARNAAVALGNTRNPDAAGPLAAALAEHDEPLVRAHAAWALGRLATVEARAALTAADAREPIPPVRAEIQRALIELRRGPEEISEP